MLKPLRHVFFSARRLLRNEGVLRGSRLLVRRWYRRLRGHELPNTPEGNREVWTIHDWSAYGEEWTPSTEWKSAVVTHLLEPNIPLGSRVLEIGPGGGRWTEYLLPRASTLTLVDVTPACIALCRKRFAEHSHVRYHVNDGSNLEFVPPQTIDRVWSYDAFVHIDPADVERYIEQLATVMASDGVAIVHHGNGKRDDAWRSDMTAARMREFCARSGFRVLDQLESLDGGRVPIQQAASAGPSDVVTIFAKV
jgi:SAM-dependent methyltransferase